MTTEAEQLRKVLEAIDELQARINDVDFNFSDRLDLEQALGRLRGITERNLRTVEKVLLELFHA